jgi:PAS domain S-box-containing protein
MANLKGGPAGAEKKVVSDPGAISTAYDMDGLGAAPLASDPWGDLLECFRQALWAGDLAGAEDVATKAFRRGEGVAAVYERMITPALHQVGALWSSGELTVADEHLATEATLRAMAGVFALADPRELPADTRRSIVTATADGERHGVGLRMAADALELAGHEVIHCGVDTPLDDLVGLATSSRADAVAISFTMACSGDGLAATAARIWSAAPTMPLIVGGQGIPSHLPCGPLTRVDSLTELIATVDALSPRLPRSPRPVKRTNPLVTRRPSGRHLELAPSTPPAPTGPSTGHLMAAFEAGHDAIATLDPSGTVTGWNRAAEELYGRPAAAAIGSSLARLIASPQDARALRRRLRDALAGTTTEAHEPHLSPVDGSTHELLVRLVPVRESERISGAVMIARDVTERRGPNLEEESEASRRLWHQRIEHALAEDRFVLASQPILDLATNEVDHCELLLRMRMGGRIVMPGDFIPPAERSGQIRTIDAWVAERGIELAPTCPVAMNLSGASLSNRSLLDTIEATLRRVAVDPGRVTFEITETAAAENLAEAAALVTRLRELGCRVALDDFGTGFGSFTYLSKLPVTELKIDNEFARGVRTGDAERRVIDAVVSVGEAFDIRTVAEGIEDTETLAIIREAGVDLGQGWLFGKPTLVEAPAG